jgi:membrane-bound acyltransferase YfiQ involved in biofilm formation
MLRKCSNLHPQTNTPKAFHLKKLCSIFLPKLQGSHITPILSIVITQEILKSNKKGIHKKVTQI